jgi:hypothetical protein
MNPTWPCSKCKKPVEVSMNPGIKMWDGLCDECRDSDQSGKKVMEKKIERSQSGISTEQRMCTPLFPTFEKRIKDAVGNLIQQQVTPWSFLMTTNGLKTKYFNGKDISYRGVGFEGSPRRVFWSSGYIDPYLENLCINEISAAVKLANDREVDIKLLLLEVQALLNAGIGYVYSNMAKVDRGLRGRGDPNSVPLQNVDNRIQFIKRFLERHIQAEISMIRPKSTVDKSNDSKTERNFSVQSIYNDPFVKGVFYPVLVFLIIWMFRTPISNYIEQKKIESNRRDVAYLLYPEVLGDVKKLDICIANVGKTQNFDINKIKFSQEAFRQNYKDGLFGGDNLDGQLANFYNGINSIDILFKKPDFILIESQGKNVLQLLTERFGVHDFFNPNNTSTQNYVAATQDTLTATSGSIVTWKSK